MTKVVLGLVLSLSMIAFVWYLKLPPEECKILYGTWRSDKDSTLSYTRKNDELKPEAESYQEQVLGNLTVTYKSDHFIEHEIPEFEITVNKKTHHWGREQSIVPYELVSCGSKSVKIKYEILGETEFVKLVFENNDLHWSGSPISGFKEYFSRVSE